MSGRGWGAGSGPEESLGLYFEATTHELKAAKRISSGRLRVAWLVFVSGRSLFQGSEGWENMNAKTPNVCLSL